VTAAVQQESPGAAVGGATAEVSAEVGTALTQTPAAELTRLRGIPGRRVLWLMAFGVLPLLALPVWFDVLYLVIGYDALLIVAMLLDYGGLKRSTRLRAWRRRELRLSVGTDNPITLVLENRGSRPTRVWARDTYPGEFEAAGDDVGSNDERTRGVPMARSSLGFKRRGRRTDEVEEDGSELDRDVQAEHEEDRGRLGLRRRLARELTPGGTTGPGLVLRPRSRTEVTYTLTPPRRGNYHFGDLWVRLESVLGLATLTGWVPVGEEVRVYPNIRGVRALGMLSRMRDLRHVGIKRVKREGGGREFSKLREYVQGDSFREINWKATARRRKPITQIYETERSQNILLCIDASRLMASRMGKLSKLDHAINAALLLAYTALSADDRVGLVVFAESVRTYLPPSRGTGQYRRILSALYAIEPELCHVDYNAVITFLMAQARSRSLVVMFTDLLDEAHSRPLVDYTRLLMPRHLPVCVTLNDSALVGMRHVVPSAEGEMFDRAVATELLREREILKNELVQMGAHVIDRPPEQLSVETINAYVDLKRRRL